MVKLTIGQDPEDYLRLEKPSSIGKKPQSVFFFSHNSAIFITNAGIFLPTECQGACNL